MLRQLVVAIVGALVGVFFTVVSLSQLGVQPAAVNPEGGVSPDLTVIVSRDLFIREANRRVGPVLQQYDLRDPVWNLREGNVIELTTTGKVPLVGSDVGITIVMQPVVREGALAIDILSIEYGIVRIGAGPLDGLAEDVNQQIAAALNRDKFEVQTVRAGVDGITLEVKVVGDL